MLNWSHTLDSPDRGPTKRARVSKWPTYRTQMVAVKKGWPDILLAEQEQEFVSFKYLK